MDIRAATMNILTNLFGENLPVVAFALIPLVWTPLLRRRNKRAQLEAKSHYEVVVVGAGISGLQAAKLLVEKHGLSCDDVLVVDALDYVGGRIKQTDTFIKGHRIEIGAEIVHGTQTLLNELGAQLKEPMKEIFCWAHGDGGPLDHDVEGGYGLYYLSDSNRLLRFDDKDEAFVHGNAVLHNLSDLNPDSIDNKQTLLDYVEDMKLSPAMIDMANAGYANTLCANINELSLRQAVRWNQIWDAETDHGDSYFLHSFKVIIDFLKSGLHIRCNTPIASINYTSDTVQLKTIAHETITAKKVIVTTPVGALKSNSLLFTPPLPKDKVAALDCMLHQPAMKIILKFQRPAWPLHLQGMIMTGCDVPETWFKIVPEVSRVADEPATCYATGFVTSRYAEALQGKSDAEIATLLLAQLDSVFSLLQPEHMAAHPKESAEKPHDLPKPSDVYLGGMVQRWDRNIPFITGGYASAQAGHQVLYGKVLATPIADKVFFAGEATSQGAGATAHAALGTGIRAAAQVARSLGKLNGGTPEKDFDY